MVASGQSLVLEYSSIVLSVFIFVMTGCDCQDSEPCAAPIRKTEPWRDVTAVNVDAEKKCDRESFQPNRWYFFQIDNQAAMIPTTCVQSHRCGATISMRINLEGQTLPQQEEYVNASLCGSYNVLGSYDCCVLRSLVTIFKCKNNDYVYRFHSPIDRCPAAICAQKIHEEVPKHAIALMGEPHPDRLNNTVSGNDEMAFNEEMESDKPLQDIMIQEDESAVEIGNNTQQETRINGTQYPTSVTSEANRSQQSESNTTEITRDASSPTNTMPDGNSNESNNSNNSTISYLDSSTIAAPSSPGISLTTIQSQMTSSSPSNTSTLTTTEKNEIPMTSNVQDTTRKDHRSPLTLTTNATAETVQIINKNTTPTDNNTLTTAKGSPQTGQFVASNVTTPNSVPGSLSQSSSPSASLPPPPLATNSPSPSTATPSTPSASTSATSSASVSTSTVSSLTTTISTRTTTTASVTSASTSIPSTLFSSSSSSLQPTTLPSSSSSASSSSFPTSPSSPAVSLVPSPSPMSTLTAQFQSPTMAPSSSSIQSQYTSASQFSRTSQPSSSTQGSSADITTQPAQPPTHEIIMIESIRFVFLGAYWDGSFGQEVVMLLNYFLNTEMAIRRVDEPSLDPWFEITLRETVVEYRNATTHVDASIAHAWPDQLLFLFETTDFADYLDEEGNLTLLMACQPSKLCQLENYYTSYTFAPPTPHSSHKTPHRSTSSTFDKNLPVLIAVATICAFCLIVMATGVICAKCRKRRRSWSAGNDIEKKSIKDSRPNCEGTPSPFTDTQIMSDEEAADGSANGSAVDGGETMQDNSWVVPLEDIELDDINNEVVAEATEDTKF